MERKFHDAVDNGHVEDVEEILRTTPSLNVNWRDDESESRSCALQRACIRGHDAIVSVLLAHPDIDVNLRDSYGDTSFMLACAFGRTSCVRLLLKDSRVKVVGADADRRTPLMEAAYRGQIDVVRWWVASGREMDLRGAIEAATQFR